MVNQRFPHGIVGLALLAASLSIPGAANAQGQAPPTVDPAFAPHASTKDSARLADGPTIPLDYRDPAHWVCRSRPGSACGDDMASTVLLADGSTRIETFTPTDTPKADCFYVYPTVSLDSGLSAGPAVTEAQRRAVRQQVERLTSVCRLFAPVYRQITVTSMKPGFPKATVAEDRAAFALAEGDVTAAWDDYIANDNHGRPIIIIGHSQGTSILIQLIKERIDGYSVRGQLVSAILPGGFVWVPTGKTLGGTFQTIPPCRTAGQTGCVIAFNTVRADRPLPADMKPKLGGMELVCTNPASLSGGPGSIKPYLSTQGETIIPYLTASQPPWTTTAVTIKTPFVTTPGLFVAECRTDEHGALLAIKTNRRPHDHRTGAVTGDWVMNGKVEATMGLHLIDLNLTAGNLVDVLGQQIAALPSK